MQRGVPGVAASLDAEGLGFHQVAPRRDLISLAHASAARAMGRFGIIGRCHRLPCPPGLPALPMHVAVGPKRGFGGRALVSEVIGIGVSTSEDESRLKAIVEAVERYCFAWPHQPGSLVREPFDAVRGDAIPLEQFGAYSATQCQDGSSIRVPEHSDPIDWTWSYSLTNRRFVLVPAAFAYPSVRRTFPNDFVRGTTSTGVATHVSVEHALLAGLLEVIERDALMVLWLNRRVPRGIRLDGSLPPELASLVTEYFTLDDVEFTLLDLTSDVGVPVVGCIGLSEGERLPSLVMGAAARPDPGTAATKALFEAAQTLVGCTLSGWGRDSVLDDEKVRTLDDHAHFYAGFTHRHHADFLTGTDDYVELDDIDGAGGVADDPPGSVPADLDWCVARLAAVGLEVLVVELTTPDVARCGFRTMRVIVPGTLDISGDVRSLRLGTARIRDAAIRAGWTPADSSELNLAPCPLA